MLGGWQKNRSWLRGLVLGAALALLLLVGCTGDEDTTDVTPVGLPSTEAVTTTQATTTTEPPTTTTAQTSTSLETTTSEQGVADSECLNRNATALFAPVEAISDFGAEEMGIYFAEDQSGTRVTRVEYGQLGRAEPGDWVPYTTVADDDLAKTHARLFFNHRRTVFALQTFLALDLEQHVTEAFRFDADADVVASWDGKQLTHADGESEAFPALGLMPPPNMDVQPLTGDERADAWEQAEEWASTMEAMLNGGRESLVGLEQQDLRAARADLCSLLDTEFAIAQEIAQDSLIFELRLMPEVFYRELAVQEVILLNEYLSIVKGVMEQPGIDWLQGVEVNWDINPQDGITSTVEYLDMWGLAAGEVLWRFRGWTAEAEPLS